MKPKKTKSLLSLIAVLFLLVSGFTAQAARGYVKSPVVDGFWIGTPEYSNNDDWLEPYVYGSPVKKGSTVTVKAQVYSERVPSYYEFTIENFSCTNKYEMSQSSRKSGETYTIDLRRDPGHAVDSWTSTATSHKGKCKFCGTIADEKHVYDNNCDTTCNICGYVRTITHDYRAATCFKPKTCNVCGTTDGTALGHSYTDGVCSVCGMEKSSGIIHITTAEQLNNFAEIVRDGQNKLSAVLDNDIDMSAYPSFRIGTSARPYEATFDGKEHTLKVALVGETHTAPFGFVGRNATVKNLIVEGTVKASGKHAAGLIACISDAYVTVQNCISLVDIISTVDGDGTHGGLVGISSGYWPEIYNCAFLGSMTGEKTTNCGGLVGWVNRHITLNNCLFAAKFDENMNTSGCNTIARYGNNYNNNYNNRVNVKNCHYLNEFGTTPSGASQITSTELESGEAAYKLNGSTNGGANWYQNIDNGKTVDTFPVPYNTHGAVYYGYANCETDEQSYTNNPKTEPHHRGGAADCLSPGYCSDCGESYIPIDPNTHRTDEVYYVYTDANTHGEYHACCDAFIAEHSHSGAPTCTNSAYCDICKTSYGEKNASAHTGTQSWIDTKKATHALTWSCCGAVDKTEPHNIVYSDVDDANDRIVITCPDCGETGTVVLEAEDTTYTGYAYQASYTTEGLMSHWKKPVEISLTYCHEGGCKTAGDHTVTMTVGEVSVEKSFTITPKKLTVTKIHANNKSYDTTNKVVSIDRIDLDGIVTYQYGAYPAFDIKDNVSVEIGAANITVSDSVPGDYPSARMTNITLYGSDKDNYTIDETLEEAAISCNANPYYTIWKEQLYITLSDQTLYGDQTPNQTSYTVEGLDEDLFELSNVVIVENPQSGRLEMDVDKAKITYNDTDVTDCFDITAYSAAVIHYCANHSFDENGFCATGECNSYAAAILNDNDTPDYEWDDYYEIYNAGQLYWFAKQVNDYGKYDISAELMEDIKVNDNPTAVGARAWTPIACADYSYYSGTFNGNGHTVSGLYCKVENGNAGFFGNLGYYSVTDLHIENSYFEGNYAGGIAGYSSARIIKCSVSESVTVKGEDVGGLVGNAPDGGLTNCFGLAAVSGNCCGGLVGKNYAEIRNCYTSAMQPVGANSGYGSFTNVYYAKDTRDYSSNDGYVTQKPTFTGAVEVEDFASGEVAYLLQGTQDEQLWGQKIGTDKFPSFGKTKVYEDTYNNVKAYRNEIDGFEILLLGADKKSATVVLDKAGTYTIVFADYNGKRLANVKSFTVTVDKKQAVRVISDKSFTLDTGDKIVLWDGFVKLTPMCDAYKVK